MVLERGGGRGVDNSSKKFYIYNSLAKKDDILFLRVSGGL